MNIVILTTDNYPHSYFVGELMQTFPIAGVLVETASIRPSFNTFHPFEERREDYERDIFFGGDDTRMDDVFPEVKEFASVNEKSALSYIKSLSPDVIITFGTGKIRPHIIDLCPKGFLNLQCGDPEQYRGLDSHLWAIYHKDFGQLIVTLHRLNSEFDDGDIVLQSAIELIPSMQLLQLRMYQTQIAIALCESALAGYKTTGRFQSRPQHNKGRYYSFMPTELKEIALRNFNSYISRLK